MYVNQETFDELCYDTLSRNDPTFIHQYGVDAYAAQTVSEKDKPIKLTFALVGLYLHVEKHLTGRQVQLAHMKLAQHKQPWPSFDLPVNRGEITVADVVAAPAGKERDEMIDRWSECVWKAYTESREVIVDLLCRNDVIF